MSQPIPKAVLEWIEGARAESYKRGHAEGYQKGWEAATSALVQAARASKPEQVVNGEPVIDFSAAETTRDRIRLVLKSNPGLRPSEVIRWFEDHDMGDNASTLLTTIKRMRVSEMFKDRNDSRLFLEDED
jgi:hypothetical protein